MALNIGGIALCQRNCYESQSMLTIGQLAKRTGLRTSALRYYEEQGLLQPATRTDAGYRLYNESAEQTLRFISRAQRLGFSLSEIEQLLQGLAGDTLSLEELSQIAGQRYLALEQQITDRLIQRHELGLFLQDLHRRTQPGATDTSANPILSELVTHICSNPNVQATTTLLTWLLRQTGCVLATHEAQTLLRQLRGRHVHIWQEEDAYQILIVDDDPAIGDALHALAQLEAGCQVHEHRGQAPEFSHNDEGYLLTVRGPSAFVFARLFLSLAEA
jgi:MerR family Zn(II)-responsive transcriptional regulator of zntA